MEKPESSGDLSFHSANCKRCREWARSRSLISPSEGHIQRDPDLTVNAMVNGVVLIPAELRVSSWLEYHQKAHDVHSRPALRILVGALRRLIALRAASLP